MGILVSSNWRPTSDIVGVKSASSIWRTTTDEPRTPGIGMVPPLLYVVSREADTVSGWRFDANLWGPSQPPAQAARRAGRPAGFEMHSQPGWLILDRSAALLARKERDR